MATRVLGTVLNNLRRSFLRQDEAGLTDSELLERFVSSRDEAAFEALVRRHGSMVLSVCQRVLRNEADAEDAFQATFLVLVRKAGSIRPRGMVGNWLYGVAHSTALKARAMSTKRLAKEREAAARPKPEVTAETWERLHTLLDQELKGLPAMYRAAIVLCDLEGKSIREAARQLGCPQGTVGTRLARGRSLLARRLSRHGLALSGGAVATVIAQNVAAAGVPPLLISSTVKAATHIAAGQAATGLISTKVAALTEGALRTMLLTKLKVIGAAVLVLTLAGTSGLRLTQLGPSHNASHAKQPQVSQAAPEGAKPEVKSTWQERAALQTQVGEAVALAFAPDGKTLAVGGTWFGKVELWDPAAEKIRTTIVGQPRQERMMVQAVAFSPDGKTLAVAGCPASDKVEAPSAGWLKFCEIATGKLYDLDHGHTGAIHAVAFAPNGKTLATASGDFTVKVFDVATRRVRASLQGHQSTVRSVAFSPEDNLLASASFDGSVKLWDVATAKEKTSLGQPVDGFPLFSCVAFSPDGKTLAVGTWLQAPEAPHDVYLFDVAMGQERRRLQGHAAWIETVAFSPDGKALASASADKVVKVWDLASGQERVTLMGHQNRLLAVAFSPDGKTLASGGLEQTFRLWELKK